MSSISIRTWGAGPQALAAGTAAALVYALMVGGTLPALEHMAGQPVFDLRPRGYDQATAQSILQNLGAQGRRFYLMRQIPLDLVYPGLMALTLLSPNRGTESLTT